MEENTEKAQPIPSFYKKLKKQKIFYRIPTVKAYILAQLVEQ